MKMKIGFTSIFPWRPHVEHTYFLAQLARQAGHTALFLTCDGDLPTCYPRELRPERAAWLQCAGCRAGGVRSYTSAGVSSIGSFHPNQLPASGRGADWSRSSASTLGRFESDADFTSPAFAELTQRLAPAADMAYDAARRWIDRERLDAICLFNGRMDVTRGVLEAARDAGVSFVSMERTWFGDGLQLLPGENCLGLRSVDQMMADWRDRPLSKVQALRAASHIASRFLRLNSKEWRAYNTAAKVTRWPVSNARRRILLVPGSRNEVWGHPDWASQWQQPTAAFDAVIEKLRLHPADLVIRCHPNWAEKIGSSSGHLSEAYFTDWALRRGIRVISSADTTSTLVLIEQADAIVIGGGSAALEAGILGKKVIAVSPSVYQQAGFQHTAYNGEQLQNLTFSTDIDESERFSEAVRVARQTLRFCYTMAHRLAQYVPYVRCATTTRYEYPEGADPERLIRLLASGNLEADDNHSGADCSEEDEVLELIRQRAWDTLLETNTDNQSANRPMKPVHRRWMFRPMDRLRDAMPRGDL
jgi:hypothetical protein